MNHAVIDLSGNFLRLGLKDNNGVWHEHSEPMRGRESSKLAEKVIECLRRWGIETDDVQQWSVGSGPGNFTGLRMAAAFIAGFAAVRKELMIRNVPSAYMYSGLNHDGTPVPAAILYDGKNSELVIYCTDTGRGYVCTWDECGDLLKSLGEIKLYTPQTDRETVCRVLENTGFSAVIAEPSLRMLADSTLPFSGSVSALEYIRPAVRPH